VSIGKVEDGNLQISVILDCYLPGVEDIKTGETLVNEAHEVCPYSRATRDNIDVTLNLLRDE
jgi:organic hydroperoxide reductase OsmC/OhrA